MPQVSVAVREKPAAAAEKWASLMTEKYDELSTQETIFGELRNLMDLCVIAALLEKEGLWDRAGLKAPILPQSPKPLASRGVERAQGRASRSQSDTRPQVVDRHCLRRCTVDALASGQHYRNEQPGGRHA